MRFEALEAWIRKLVPDLGKEVHRWSGQVLDTHRLLRLHRPQPGRAKASSSSTGDSGQGITHGALAGMLLKDLILDGPSPWEEVYDPRASAERRSATYVSENVTAIKNFAEYVCCRARSIRRRAEAGRGRHRPRRPARVAACRDHDGKLHLRSRRVHASRLPRSLEFDRAMLGLPCHGSQFAPDGTVLNGPALRRSKRRRHRPKADAGTVSAAAAPS